LSTAHDDFNAKIIDEFRANDGRVGGMFESMPILLVHHTGAKSGAKRINPVAYLENDGRYAIFASKGGAPLNPAWYYNLKANPRATVEVGTETVPVVVSEATGEERDRLYAAQAQRIPAFAEYEQKTDRRIPVLVLTPTAP
jgi:deazaflavin-dependent oxidoreductase (nitroreductase family)